MPSIPEMALAEAEKLGLDLRVLSEMVPTEPFVFHCLTPKESMLEVFKDAFRERKAWVEGMPVPVLVYYPEKNEFGIMDGMQRICAAQKAGLEEIPALIASGETYDILRPILENGYYGEDFVEMLAMANENIRRNLSLRDRNRMAGIR